jgi:predicted type IV restriction endonuclease
MHIEEAVTRAREQLVSGQLSEAAVSQGPVKRILSSLGWDVFDTSVVVPEFSVGPRRVDYALRSAPQQVAVFLEIKAPGKADGEADRQLFEYAFHQGVPIAVLTDGRTWSFYLPAGQGSYEERRFLKLDLLEHPIHDTCLSLERYLRCDRIKSGEAQSVALADYNDKFRRARVRDLIPSAWNRLLRDSDPALVELLSDEVEEALGQRPAVSDVADFLKNLTLAKAEITPVVKALPLKTPLSPPPLSEELDQPKAGLGYSIKNGAWRECRSGRQTYVELIKEFARLDPTFLEKFAVAGKGKKRRWLSRDPELLFPGRADLQHKSIEVLNDGWLLGLNISAEIEIPRRIEVACAVVGLVFGKDVRAKFK